MNDWMRGLQEAMAAGDPAFMKAMLERVPDNLLRQARPYLAELANSHVREGRFAEYPEAHRGRAQALIQLARYDDALKAAEQLTRLAMQDADAHRLRGEAYAGLGERVQALAA
jgi:Flp pilus assembly protein TadD